MSHVAFLGTGLMGSAFVEALRGRGVDVVAWNRTASRAQPLLAHGARVASTAAEAVRGAVRVHLSLSDDVAVDATLDEIIPALGPGVLVVDHTTVSPSGTAARAARMVAAGAAFLHAPVFMAPANARARTGLMLCSGPRAHFSVVEAELKAMTGELWYLGERPDQAAAFKLFGNAMIATISAGLADVFTLARAAGIGAEDAHTLWSHFNPMSQFTGRGVRMAQGDFRPSFELLMARKDVRLMLETASGGSAPLSVLPAVARRMDELIARGFGHDDLAVLAVDAVPRRDGKA
ncbi:MAG: NAD(P)-dependent oxidoreductase [Myxococcota bacterium]